MPSKKAPPGPATEKTSARAAEKAKANKVVEEVTEKAAKQEEAVKPDPVARPPAERKRNLRAWMILAALAVAFVGGIAVWPKYGAEIEKILPPAWRPGSDLANQRIDEIAGALDEIVARLAGAENTMAHREQVRELAEKLEAALARIDGLKSQGADLQSRATAFLTEISADLNQRLTATDQRLDKLAQSTKSALVVAASQRPVPSAGASSVLPDESSRDLLGNLAERLDVIDALPLNVAAQSEAIARLSATIDLMKADSRALQSRLATTEAKLGALQTAAGGDNTAAVLVAATAQLRVQAERGASYAADLAAVTALLGTAPEELSGGLADLQRHAAAGVLTIDALRQQFSSIAGSLVQLASQKIDWIDQAKAQLASLIRVRRTGDVAGDSNEARIARAELRLEAGELAAAVAEISALSQPALNAASGWLGAARARLAVEAALASLSSHAIVQITAGATSQ
mgnify:CR=1 FL=1